MTDVKGTEAIEEWIKSLGQDDLEYLYNSLEMDDELQELPEEYWNEECDDSNESED